MEGLAGRTRAEEAEPHQQIELPGGKGLLVGTEDAGELALLEGVGVEPGLLQPGGRGGFAVAERREVGPHVVEGQGMRAVLVEHRVEPPDRPPGPRAVAGAAAPPAGRAG